MALNDAAPLYRHAPEAEAAKALGTAVIQAFLRDALPCASEAARTLAGDLITATLSEVGRRFSEQPRRPAEITAYADAMADMLCGYLTTIEAACFYRPASALCWVRCPG